MRKCTDRIKQNKALLKNLNYKEPFQELFLVSVPNHTLSGARGMCCRRAMAMCSTSSVGLGDFVGPFHDQEMP